MKTISNIIFTFLILILFHKSCATPSNVTSTLNEIEDQRIQFKSYFESEIKKINNNFDNMVKELKQLNYLTLK